MTLLRIENFLIFSRRKWVSGGLTIDFKFVIMRLTRKNYLETKILLKCEKPLPDKLGGYFLAQTDKI